MTDKKDKHYPSTKAKSSKVQKTVRRRKSRKKNPTPTSMLAPRRRLSRRSPAMRARHPRLRSRRRQSRTIRARTPIHSNIHTRSHTNTREINPHTVRMTHPLCLRKRRVHPPEHPMIGWDRKEKLRLLTVIVTQQKPKQWG